MSPALTRRRALVATAAAALGLGAGVAPAMAGPVLSANDRRLVELADAYWNLDRQCNEHTLAHRDDHTPETDDEFDLMVEGFGPLEEECAAISADSLVGVVAKARLCRNPTARGCADFEHIASVVDDVWRLFGGGALA